MTDLEAARERMREAMRRNILYNGRDVRLKDFVVACLEAQRDEVERCVELFPPNSKAWLAIRLRERVAELDKQIEEARR